MKYKNVVKGIFHSRPNRFIANVEIDGVLEKVHVKNTGRCKELLIAGAEVYLSVADQSARKTKYDLVAVKKIENNRSTLINMDSQIPNDAVGEWLGTSGLFSEEAFISREVTFGSSRFDFFVSDGERKAFLEVKGVTLEKEGVALFPDAPTLRGVKHIQELIHAVELGYEAYVLFIIQMKGVEKFMPNRQTHPEFACALKEADQSGVKLLAMDCIVTEDSIIIDSEIPIEI